MVPLPLPNPPPSAAAWLPLEINSLSLSLSLALSSIESATEGFQPLSVVILVVVVIVCASACRGVSRKRDFCAYDPRISIRAANAMQRPGIAKVNRVNIASGQAQ